MDKGHIVRRLENDATPQIIAFERYAVDLNQLEQRVDQAGQLRPRERSTAELLARPDDALYRQAPGGLRPSCTIACRARFMPLASCCWWWRSLGHAQTTRQNRNQAAVAAFALAVGCRIGGIVATNAAAVRSSAIPVLYAVPLPPG